MSGTSSCPPAPSIPRLAVVPSYDEFANECLRPNKPCILPREMVEHWPIFDRLPTSTPEDPNVLHPAFDILRVRYGQHVVPVAVPGEEGGLDGAGCGRTEMPLADAIQLMHARKARGLDQDPTSPGIYVKDWHLFRLERLRRHELSSRASDASAAGSVYEPPPLFRDDWMNNLPRPDSDDFAFCYAGSCGSATGLHRDVYTSYSWSTNVVGRKRWRLFPPHCAAKLRRFPNVRTSELASNCDELDAQYKSGLLGPVANGKLGWPEWAEARAQACEIFQEPGETIFVPSNWYHEVLNITDCISINHNWCNSYNLESMFRSMVEEVEDVSSSLEDVRMMLETGGDKTWQVEWVKIVQDVARQDAGWAWEGFFNMVELNLTVPPAERHLRPSSDQIHAIIRGLINQFHSRPEAKWLGDDVAACIQRITALIQNDP